MKLKPENILAARAPQVALLSLLTAAVAALWWLCGAETVVFKVCKLLLYLVAAFTVSWLLFAAKLTRMFEFTPSLAALFTLLCVDFALKPSASADWLTYLTPVAVTLVLLCILNITRRLWKADHASEEMFLITLLLCAAAFLYAPALLLIVVVWLVFIVLQSFSLKTLLASLIGLACAAIMAEALSHLLFSGCAAKALLDSTDTWGKYLVRPAVIGGLSARHVAIAAVLGGLAVCNIVYHHVSHYRDDQYTRVLLNTWSILAVALIMLFMIFGTPLLLTPLALLMLMLQLHSTALRPSWFIFALWVIFALTMLALPLTASDPLISAGL